jgi:hypothetical protein
MKTYLTQIVALSTAIIITLFLSTNLAVAHQGGLDKRGGHFNRKTGVYHCHTSSCERRIDNQDPRRICNYGHGKNNCSRQEIRHGY